MGMRAYLREHSVAVGAFFAFTALFAASFALYGLPLAAVAYPAGLCLLLGAGLVAFDLLRRLTAELGRVEQYVDMVLTYLRLEEGGSDYVIRECDVDEVVRAAVRRFAGEFIDRRIALDYTPVEWRTVTDGKWLTFVVEQLLSNALKYTGQDGTIRVYRDGDDLCVSDSGMGIAPEDVPRVFDMGYTGQNGRLDRRSSGIGLYLCRRICGNLRHGIRIESTVGKGTTVRVTLERGEFVAE